MSAPDLLRPHHDPSPLHVQPQRPRLGETVRVRLRVPAAYAVTAVHVRSNPDREPRFDEAIVVASIDGWDWWQAEMRVANPTHGYRFAITLVDGSLRWLNATGIHDIETPDVEDFKLVAEVDDREGWGAPEWAAETVLYEVFPDRFARSDHASQRGLPEWAIAAEWADPVDPEPPGRSQQLYGGDLDGVVERLDHLSRLGVNLLYLTPYFPARSNHRYDALSFDEVDPLLGGDAALVRLVEEAHARGIRVIGDLTTNHSGDAHEWFRAAFAHPEAPESGFYLWHDEANQEYESWLGVPTLPKFDWHSRELRRRFIDGSDSVVAKWLRPPFNLDGWRIDVANMTGRHGADDLNVEVRQTIRRTMVEANPDTLLIAESTNDAAPDFQGDAWHGAMSYAYFTRPLWAWLARPGSHAAGGIGFAHGRVPLWSGRQLHHAFLRFGAVMPWSVRLISMNALDTHDTPRFAGVAAPGTVEVGFGLAVTLPGMPVVFAGDELGLLGDDGELSRTPMPWHLLDGDGDGGGDGTDGGGGDRRGGGSAEATQILDLYRGLIALRRDHVALQRGGLRWLHVSEDVLVFVREHPTGSVLVVAARARIDVTLAAGAVSGEPRRLRGDLVAERDGGGGIRLVGGGPAFAAFALPAPPAPAW